MKENQRNREVKISISKNILTDTVQFSANKIKLNRNKCNQQKNFNGRVYDDRKHNSHISLMILISYYSLLFSYEFDTVKPIIIPTKTGVPYFFLHASISISLSLSVTLTHSLTHLLIRSFFHVPHSHS